MNKHTYFQWLTNAKNDLAARILKLKDLAKNKPAVETPIIVGVCAMAKKVIFFVCCFIVLTFIYLKGIKQTNEGIVIILPYE